MANKFCVFIISHERSDRVETYDTLLRGGYTGEIYIVIDNEDSQKTKYVDRFGKFTIVFDKQYFMRQCDCVGESRRASAIYARNAVEYFAKELKVDSYAVMDDDIVALRYKWIVGKTVKSMQVNGGLDDVFKLYADYIIDNRIATTSFQSVMFYVGGAGNISNKVSASRETYQIHIRNANYPVAWKSVINEDIITEILTAQQGYIWWSLPHIVYDAVPMNDKSGGVKDAYDTISAFDRAFLATIVNPSCCKPGYSHGKMRIIQDRKSSYPMIVSSRYKK